MLRLPHQLKYASFQSQLRRDTLQLLQDRRVPHEGASITASGRTPGRRPGNFPREASLQPVSEQSQLVPPLLVFDQVPAPLLARAGVRVHPNVVEADQVSIAFQRHRVCLGPGVGVHGSFLQPT
eukprot:CAMPEP_0183331962 /NCGR_PEP_ID=MMETSP0164_2-20130417/1242_1 /TAXON_ID=221442 /ORGANISM="Coccolithus pelagicus ssp braarudi, Strain PLY182g" /LENGTH=123 /DNA_ID=CAMNT_0025500579 /DNA_START=653 /DNA_END=1024 /DNA_ORIENTATION=+